MKRCISIFMISMALIVGLAAMVPQNAHAASQWEDHPVTSVYIVDNGDGTAVMAYDCMSSGKCYSQQTISWAYVTYGDVGPRTGWANNPQWCTPWHNGRLDWYGTNDHSFYC